MLLDIPDGMLGEILVDLSDDSAFDIGMKCASQVCERFGWRDEHKRRDFPCPHNLLHRGGAPFRERVLLDVMPIDRFDGASLTRVQRFADTSWPLASLV